MPERFWRDSSCISRDNKVRKRRNRMGSYSKDNNKRGLSSKRGSCNIEVEWRKGSRSKSSRKSSQGSRERRFMLVSSVVYSVSIYHDSQI